MKNLYVCLYVINNSPFSNYVFYFKPTTEATLPTGTLPHLLGMKEIFQTITTMGIYSSKSIEVSMKLSFFIKSPRTALRNITGNPKAPNLEVWGLGQHSIISVM